MIVILTRTREYVKKTERVTKAVMKLYRDYPNLAESLKNRSSMYNQCMRELYQAEKEGKVFVFAPEDTCGVGRTESSPRKLGRLYEEGYYQAKESMHALRLYLNN